MKLIIDIDDRYYELVKRKVNLKQWEYIHIPSILIANGTPLPKGHGKIMDSNEFNHYLISRDSSFKALIAEIPPIIEADGGGEE